MMPRRPLADRFWPKVEKTESCWLWRAAIKPNGYGYFRVSDTRMAFAHRVAHELTKGPIPDGQVIDHLCRVHHCVNPDHLEAVTQRVNTLRGRGPAAWLASKTRCHRDHPFDEGNTRITKKGYRQCRACERVRNARRAEQRKGRS